MILHNSRIRHKRTQVSGTTPTIGPSDDFTDDTWVDSDIYPGEFFVDMGGQVGWFGYSGTTSGVGVWMSGDTSVGSITSIDDEISVTQTGANIIVSYVGQDKNYGGFNYRIFDFNITPAAAFISQLFTFTTPGIFTIQAKILIMDTSSYSSYFGVFTNSVNPNTTTAISYVYDGTTLSAVGGIFGSAYVNNPYEQSDLGFVEPLFFLSGGDELWLRINFGTPSNYKCRLIVKSRFLYAP